MKRFSISLLLLIPISALSQSPAIKFNHTFSIQNKTKAPLYFWFGNLAGDQAKQWYATEFIKVDPNKTYTLNTEETSQFDTKALSKPLKIGTYAVRIPLVLITADATLATTYASGAQRTDTTNPATARYKPTPTAKVRAYLFPDSKERLYPDIDVIIKPGLTLEIVKKKESLKQTEIALIEDNTWEKVSRSLAQLK